MRVGISQRCIVSRSSIPIALAINVSPPALNLSFSVLLGILLLELNRLSASRALRFLKEPRAQATQVELMRAIQFFALPDVVKADAALDLLHVFCIVRVFGIRSDYVFKLADFENELSPFVKLEQVGG